MQKSQTQYVETYDVENALKSAFFTLREIPDRNNKLENMKVVLMTLIEEAQSGKFNEVLSN